jgi:hypothetical protein
MAETKSTELCLERSSGGGVACAENTRALSGEELRWRSGLCREYQTDAEQDYTGPIGLKSWARDGTGKNQHQELAEVQRSTSNQPKSPR